MRLPHGLVRFVSNRLEARQLALHADAARAQERLLGRILDTYRSTEIGRAMGIADVRSVEAFRREVPVRGGDAYQAHWSNVLTSNPPGFLHEKPLKYVAVSSGSTGAQKPVPVPAELLASYRRFTNHLFFHAFRELGRYDIFDGHVLVAAGPAVKEIAPSGVLVGFGSGIASVESPRFARSIVKPSAATQGIHDRDAKLAAIAEEAMSLDVRACSGIPASAIAMFERVLGEARARGRSAETMRELYPNLALYGYSGMSIEPYRARLRELLGADVPTYEVYSSTESPIAFQYRLGEPGMIVDLSCVVLELVPVDSPDTPRIGLADAEPGREYSVVITSPGGMFAYSLGDRIRVASTSPYVIEFARRGTDEINYAGEKLELGLLRDALRAVLAESGAQAGPFVVMPTERSQGRAAGYELVLELDDVPRDLAARVDARLRSTQYNYAAMRADDSAIGALVVRALPRGTLEKFLHTEKVFGHAKLPEVQNDRSVLPGILAAAAALEGERSR